MEEEIVEKQPTKGQLFKIKFGYSKTMKRLMNQYGVSTLEEYRKIRRKKSK